MMSNSVEEQLSKSRTTYRNLHQPTSPTMSLTINKSENKIVPSEDSEDDTTLPTFVNDFFLPKNPIKSLSSSSPSSLSPPPPAINNDTGMFRAIRGQVIIHHDNDRSSKVQCEENGNKEAHGDDDAVEDFQMNRANVGNYELHYDVDNPLEISCSMSLSSAETISDHSPPPTRGTSLININRNKISFKNGHSPIEPSDDEDNDDTPPSMLSDDNYHEKETIDCDSIKEQDEKLETFRGWHLSMLKQIDEKLREIELETAAATTKIAPIIQNKKSTVEPQINRKKNFRSTVRRRFETTNVKPNSPVPPVKINSYRSRTPSIEKESRTLIINLPPPSSSSSSESPASSESDDDKHFPPRLAPSEPINIRIVHSPIYPLHQRSQSTEHLTLRDQSAQTEPFYDSNGRINQQQIRPASIECDRMLSTRSLTRKQGNQFLQHQHQRSTERPTKQIKFYSLRSRNMQAKPNTIRQPSRPVSQWPPASTFTYKQPVSVEKKCSLPSSNFHQNVSLDPSVYSDDYGHVTQMDTKNLGSLVDKVFDDIYQDKPSDFYRDYRQLLHDIQIRFSMVSAVERQPVNNRCVLPPPPIHRQPPPPPRAQPQPRPSSQLPSRSFFVDYARLSQPSSSQTRLCDTLIYIPNLF